MDARTFFLLNVGGGAPSAPVGRIVPSGAYFVDASGKIVIRKSISGFCAPKRFQQDRGSEARDYFDWWASKGGNEVRIFARVDWTGPPGSGVESGWQYSEGDTEACIVEAAAAGLRVEVVAHTGPSGTVQDMANHLRNVDELCLRQPSALLEVWNEPFQNAPNGLLDAVLNLYTPRTPGWASGNYDPTPYTAGPSMGTHTPRKDEWSRCAKDAYEFSTGAGPYQEFTPGYTGPIMLDEPPQVEQTLRDEGQAGWSAVDDWAAYGAGCAFWGCGGTLHGNPDFQQCVIPADPRVVNCAEAFLAGLNDVPLQRYSGYNRGDPPSEAAGSRRYFRWGEDSAKWELCIRPYSLRKV